MNHSKEENNGWIFRYTGMFLIGIFVLAGMLQLRHKAPVLESDGFMQHYTVLGYISRIVRGLLAGNGFRLVDFSLGQGMDVLTTLTYYGLTDPLNLLSALFPEFQTAYAYMLIACLRAYLLGICFIAYARKVGVKDGWALSCSAIIFVFSGFFVWNLGRHTYFLNGALCLCLLLLGVETVLRDRRWVGYSLSVALMLLMNFYFAYMNTVVAIIYIVARLASRWSAEGVRGTARDGFTLLSGYFLGAALSAFAFVPTVQVFLGNARRGEAAGYAGSMLLYPFSHYTKCLVSAFSSLRLSSYWTMLNYTPLALVCALLLFLNSRRRHMCLKVALVLCAAGLCLPIVGRIMNGNSYVTNRWCYVLAVFMALTCARMLPKLADNPPEHRRCIAILTALYFVSVMASMIRTTNRSPFDLLSLLLGLCLSAIYGVGALHRLGRPRAKHAVSVLLVLLVILQAAALGNDLEWVGQLMDSDIQETYRNETISDQLGGEGVYRIDQHSFRDPHAIMKGYMGTSFYWSMVSSNLGDYYRSLGLSSQKFLDSIQDLGGSAELYAVAAVRYFTVPGDKAAAAVPYGFTEAGSRKTEDGSSFLVYENLNVLPLGYAYDNALTEAEYEALPVERRIQALLSRAICGEGDADIPVVSAPDAAEGIPWQWGGTTDAEITENTLQFGKDGTVRMEFDAPGDGETWLLLDEMQASVETTLVVESALGIAYSKILERDNNFYFHRPVTAICLGGGAEALHGCTLSTDVASQICFDSIRVVSLPLSAYREDAAARRAEAMEDVRLGTNSLKGSITVGGDRVLQIAVPWSSGWSARVDGQPARVFRCGGMYMGIALGAGTHEIEMRYVTPGLRIGAIISAAALALLIALLVRSRRRALVLGNGG